MNTLLKRNGNGTSRFPCSYSWITDSIISNNHWSSNRQSYVIVIVSLGKHSVFLKHSKHSETFSQDKGIWTWKYLVVQHFMHYKLDALGDCSCLSTHVLFACKWIGRFIRSRQVWPDIVHPKINFWADGASFGALLDEDVPLCDFWSCFLLLSWVMP